ncbi:phospholipase B1, membrane-associated-like [Periplaneta americana]|uniref:phospholipase B1, membrane-associated-like n=1 Tax=Periplaneta americana TaxID=6978 RepID=UPI0037E7733B
MNRHLLSAAVLATMSLQVLNQVTYRNGFGSYRIVSAVRRQAVLEDPFPCPTWPGSPGARSQSRPRSVHQLRPGDIDVVGALGDSLIAGNGALEEFAIGALIEHRGVSWCAGGQETWREFLTVPNILRMFNPRLVGYSTGRGEFLARNSNLNVAFPVSAAKDTLAQARLLVTRMQHYRSIDFERDWKMVTVMIGANDLCSGQCYNRTGSTAEHHRRDLQEALDYLYRHVPRCFVNLVPVIDVSVSVRVKRSPMCRILHNLFCPCFHQGGGEMDTITQLVRDYQDAAIDLVSSGRYDAKDDFTVVVQPFIRFLNAPSDRSSRFKEAIHVSFVTHDCFHFSQKGHAMAANLLWNNLLEPEWNKSQQMPENIMERFLCPTADAPYLFTRKNSRKFFYTGSQ